MTSKNDSIDTPEDLKKQPPAGPTEEEKKQADDASTTVSRVLREAGRNAEVIDEILPMVYKELRSIASLLLYKERPEHTLSATALVHEAYLRLYGSEPTSFSGRKHFFAAAAVAMRRALVDHARRRQAQKRIPRDEIVALEETPDLVPTRRLDVLALDEALNALAELNPRMVKTVELRHFAGLTEQETAEVLGLSPTTVRRTWAAAKVWLRRRMGR